jgi:hypothetical protein
VKLTGRHGRHRPYRLRFDPVEAQVLADLFDGFDDLLAGPPAGGPDSEALARLFPAAYPDDESAAAEFRALTETSLRDERAERVGLCRAELADGGDIELGDPEIARRWIQVLNDLRLTLGTRLGVTEDDEHRVDPADPDHQDRLVYHWLTAVQDTVVSALMG